MGAGLCSGMGGSRVLLCNPPSLLSGIEFPLLVLLPKVEVGGRDVVGIEFLVFGEVY